MKVNVSTKFLEKLKSENDEIKVDGVTVTPSKKKYYIMLKEKQLMNH